MIRLLGYLKKHWFLVFAIIILITGQVVAQLFLPDMMSKIINNGIYYDYQEMTPYKAARDASNNVIYVKNPATGEEVEIYDTKIPMPDLTTGMPQLIGKTDPDYKLFEISPGRLLPKIDMTGERPQIVLKTDINGNYIQTSDTNYILRIGGLMLLLTLSASIAAILANYLASIVAMALGRKVRSKVFRKVESFSINEFDKFGNASLMIRTTNDVSQVQTVLVMALRMLVMCPIMFVGALILAYNKSGAMTGVLGVTIPIILTAIIIAASIAIPMFKKMQKNADRLALVSRENISGVRIVRAFNQEMRETERFDTANKNVVKVATKVNRVMIFLLPLVFFIMSFTTVAIIWMASNEASSGNFANVGNMMAIIQYAMQIMFSLMMLTMMFVLIPRASVSADRINQVLKEPASIKDNANAKDYGNLNGKIEFRNVSYKFSKTAEKYALQNVSFTAMPGKVTAIVGSTGSGKSTLVNLIPRFIDPTEGEIYISDKKISDIKIEALRKLIGFVPQKANLFTGTIADNIRFGKEDATQEEIAAACKTAQAGDFVEASENKYDSFVSQGGTNFSGGQKQRLSIARALVRKPEIYIFDDSFSALDFKTDAALRKALAEEIKDKTIIIIAQRIGTIMNADNIMVLEEGKIAASGTHKQLLKTSKIYREIASSQLSEEELNEQR